MFSFKKEEILKYVGRTLLVIITFLALFVLFLFGVVMMLEFGPSTHARNLFVNSAMESSAGKFLATAFLGEERVEEIQSLNALAITTETTDTSLIKIGGTDVESMTEEELETVDPVELAKQALAELGKNMDYEDLAPEDEGIEIYEVYGDTYRSKVALIHDPSRVCVANCGHLGTGRGQTVADMATANGAVLAINGGGFEDEDGHGTGAIPIGLVIQDGELKWGEAGATYEVIGFDRDNILQVGYMTAQNALDRGIQSALAFGPILIVNGEPAQISGQGSGLNPRTAVGQAADGTVILIVVDGRQPNSLGATYADLIDLMLEFGAVNAANLDGGSSSMMWYNGDYINVCTSLYGARSIPTTLLVK